MDDVIEAGGYLFLGSRLKRLGERMQADVLRIAEAAGLPIQPSQYAMLVAIERAGEITVGDIAAAIGTSQPGVTRNLAKLAELGLVETIIGGSDGRCRCVTLTAAGREAMALSRATVWPRVEAAAAELAMGREGGLLQQLAALEAALAERPLHTHVSMTAGLSIVPWSDDRARDFHDINAEWISSMYAIEAADRLTLENPRAEIIDKGGDILFVSADGLGIVGACALRPSGDGAFELTKMGVLERARGRKAGEFLLHAVIRRARELGADLLYLLSNRKSQAAIHLYEKLGFAHDAEIMATFGECYGRCDVAMRYQPQ